MCRAFHAEAKAGDIAAFDRRSMADTLYTLIDQGLVLIGEGCMGVLLIYPLYFNHDHIGAQELLWYVEPDSRGRGVGVALLDAIEHRARELGAQSLSMISLASLPGPEKLYLERGYVATENSFTRIL